MEKLKSFARKIRYFFQVARLFFPKKVQCNVCGWEGRHFLSDAWHKHILCPRCRTKIRHRLFLVALQNIENLSFEKIIKDKKILHFAPSDAIARVLRSKSAHYSTADLLRRNCDFKLDMSNMPEIRDEAFDVVIAFDVLEHVPDYHKAIEEVRRILSRGGFAVFAIPQKEKLLVTYEDPGIIRSKDKIEHFGRSDHKRIFGKDFPDILTNKGFSVTAIDRYAFSGALNKKHVLFPPKFSIHPLATNERKIFFCQKTEISNF